jgi:hypothetical protein
MNEVGFAVQLGELSPWAKDKITYTSSTMEDKRNGRIILTCTMGIQDMN